MIYLDPTGSYDSNTDSLEAIRNRGAIAWAGNDKPYRKIKKKKCTHEHAIRGKCLYCGEENVK